jgi:hypothetical protein
MRSNYFEQLNFRLAMQDEKDAEQEMGLRVLLQRKCRQRREIIFPRIFPLEPRGDLNVHHASV